MESKLVGFFRDLNGSLVRVAFENRRYFYEVIDGIPYRWISNYPPGRDLTYIFGGGGQ